MATVDSNQFRYTAEILREFAEASLQNSIDLVREAILLSENDHFPRAYFLGIASVEESGKAFLAFGGMGRSLQDSAVTSNLRRCFEDHGKKINAGFHAWLLKSPDAREAVMPAIDLMIALKNGREPSMYTDFDYSMGTLKLPSAVVSRRNAEDCIKIATNCLVHTLEHVKSNSPAKRSRAEDELFGIKDRKLTALLNQEDFWWYYISCLEAGSFDWAAAVADYRNNYELKGKTFR